MDRPHRFLALVLALSCSGPPGESTAPAGTGENAGGGDSRSDANPGSGGMLGSGGSMGSGADAESGGSGGTRASGGHSASGGGPGSAGSAASGGQLVAGGDPGSGGGVGSGGHVDSGGGGLFPHDGTPRIMIVGDSISAGPGCYKKYLLQELASNGFSHFEFVGQYADDCGGGVRHSAVSCSKSGDFTQDAFSLASCFPGETFPGMAALMASHDPDLVMLQLGVNDVWSGDASIPSILSNYTKLLEQARAHNPNVVFVVAQLHRIITNDCTNAASTSNAEALGTAIPGWAVQVSTRESPVLVADLWTNSDPSDSDDCVHPNDAGARRMALNWFHALKGILPHG